MPTATETLNSASQFGPSIWFAVFITIVMLLTAAAYMKYVGIPGRIAQEENNKKLTEVVSKLTVVVDRTDSRTAETHEAVDEVRVVLNAIATAKSSELDALSKVAKKAGVDVQRELSEASGIMRFVRHEYPAHHPATETN